MQSIKFTIGITSHEGVAYSTQSSVSIKANDLNSCTLSQSNKKVFSTSTLTFEFGLSNAIPSEGYLILTLPSETTYPDIHETQLQIGDGEVVTVIVTDLGYGGMYKIVHPYLTAGVPVQEGRIITITIGNFENPTALGTTISGFFISTMVIAEGSAHKINQNKNILSITTEEPGSITLGSPPLFVHNEVVQEPTSIDIKFSMQHLFGPNGHVRVTFPREIERDSQSQEKNCGFEGAWEGFMSGHCEFVQKAGREVLTTYGAYTTETSNLLTLKVNSLLMPVNTKPTSPILIETLDENNQVVCSSEVLEPSLVIEATPGKLSEVVLERNGDTVVDKETSFHIKFTPLHKHSWNANIRLVLPNDQFRDTKISPSNKYTTDPPELTCSKIYPSSESQTVIWCKKDWCYDDYCPPTEIDFILSGETKNPNIAKEIPDGEVSIQVCDGDGGECIFSYSESIGEYTFPALNPAVIGDLVVNRISGEHTGESTEIELLFTSITSVPHGGHITFNFPDQLYYTDTTNPPTLSGTHQTLTTYPSSSLKSITSTSPCPDANCPGDTYFTYTLKQLLNTNSMRPFNYKNIYVTTQTPDSHPINRGSNGNTGLGIIQNEFEGVEVTTGSDVTGNVDSATIAWGVRNKVNKGTGEVVLVLPGEFRIVQKFGNPLGCVITYGGVNRICEIDQGNGKAWYRLGEDDPVGEGEMRMSISYVRNPSSMKTSSFFWIYSQLYYEGVPYLIDESKTDINYTANTPHILDSLQIRRTKSEINERINIEITIQIYNSLPGDTGEIVLEIPKSRVLVVEGASPEVYIHPDDTFSTPTQLSKIFKDNTPTDYYYTITILNPCGDNKCEEHSTLYISVANLQNPNDQPPPLSQSPVHYFKVLTQIKEGMDVYGADTDAGGVLAIPQVSRGQLVDLTLSRDGNAVGGISHYIFGFTLEHPIDSVGSVSIIVVNELIYEEYKGNTLTYYASEGNTGDGEMTSVPGSVSSTLNPRLQIKEIEEISIPLNCPCPAGSKKKVKISGVVNTLYVRNVEVQREDIILTTRNIDGSGIDSGSISPNINTETLSAYTQTITLSRENKTVDSPTPILINFQTTHRIEADTYFTLFLPEYKLVKVESPTCTVKRDGAHIHLPCEVIKEEGGVLIRFKESCSGQEEPLEICKEGTEVEVKINGFRNAHSDRPDTPVDHVSLEGYTPNTEYLIFKTDPLDIPLLLEAGEIYEIDVSLTNRRVHNPTIVGIRFKSRVEILGSENLVLTFTKGLVYRDMDTDIVCMRITSQVLEMACHPTLHHEGWLESIQIPSLGPGVKDTIISIKIYGVINIYEVKPYTGVLTINIQEYIGEGVIPHTVSTGNLDLSTIPLLSPALLKDVSLTRSDLHLSTAVDLTLKFKLTTGMLPNSKISILMPDSALTSSGTSITCEDVVNTGESLIECTLSSNNGIYNLQITPPCVSVCPADEEFNIIIKGFSNKDHIVFDGETITLQTLSTSKNIMHEYIDIRVTPHLLMNGLQILKFEYEFIYTNTLTDILFELSIIDPLRVGGKILLFFPKGVFVGGGVITGKNSIDESVLQLELAYFGEGGDVKYIYISGLCLLDCHGTLNFTLMGLRNPLDNRPFIGDLVVYAMQPDNVINNGGYFQMSDKFILPSIFLPISVQREKNWVGKDSIYTFGFTVSHPVPDGGYFSIYMPDQQITIADDELLCKSDGIHIYIYIYI